MLRPLLEATLSDSHKRLEYPAMADSVVGKCSANLRKTSSILGSCTGRGETPEEFTATSADLVWTDLPCFRDVMVSNCNITLIPPKILQGLEYTIHSLSENKLRRCLVNMRVRVSALLTYSCPDYPYNSVSLELIHIRSSV